MKRKRFNEEQIIGILKESEAGGKNQQICRKHGISEQTFYRWRSKYGRLQVSEARRLQQLEAEVHLDRAAQTYPQDPPHAGPDQPGAGLRFHQVTEKEGVAIWRVVYIMGLYRKSRGTSRT